MNYQLLQAEEPADEAPAGQTEPEPEPQMMLNKLCSFSQ